MSPRVTLVGLIWTTQKVAEDQAPPPVGIGRCEAEELQGFYAEQGGQEIRLYFTVERSGSDEPFYNPAEHIEKAREFVSNFRAATRKSPTPHERSRLVGMWATAPTEIPRDERYCLEDMKGSAGGSCGQAVDSGAPKESQPVLDDVVADLALAKSERPLLATRRLAYPTCFRPRDFWIGRYRVGPDAACYLPPTGGRKADLTQKQLHEIAPVRVPCVAPQRIWASLVRNVIHG
ncbi:hypothetical protein N7532_009048 [Penicillium argentinense]|uniref:Uncharacterized protein n=1 Tax=Penicillium argentinense TaxID=1131581 RepID=A0A9W9EYI0_9EURO|nr:uncharacterized protein N7532_009048 [Penicillium argentinense]KAJ5090364.1 hypothetical protein N7532_009048 [Penicillium argentinense]